MNAKLFRLLSLALILLAGMWPNASVHAQTGNEPFLCEIGSQNVVKAGQTFASEPCTPNTVKYALDINHVVTRYDDWAKAEEHRGGVAATYWIEELPVNTTEDALLPASSVGNAYAAFDCTGETPAIYSPTTPLPPKSPCDGVLEYKSVDPWAGGCTGGFGDPRCSFGFEQWMTYDEVLDYNRVHNFDRGSVWVPKMNEAKHRKVSSETPAGAETFTFTTAASWGRPEPLSMH